MTLLQLVPDRTETLPEPEEKAAAPRGRGRNPETWLALSLTALVVTVLAINITGFPGASDDEGTYLAQAWAVASGKGLAHYTYWYDHPPLAWIQLAALSWLPGVFGVHSPAVAAGRIAMLPVIAASLMLIYTIARRMGMAVWSSAAALLIFGLSPLAITMDREIYLDSFAVAWMLGALALVLSPRRHLWHVTAAGAATAIAVLSKETMLVTAPAVVVALWQNAARSSTRPWAIGGYASGVVLVGAFYPLYALLRGELFPGPGHVSLIGAWQFQLASRSGSGSIFTDGSGANDLLHSWLFYDPVILVAGLVATVAILPVRRLRPPAVAGVILTLVALRPGGYLPAMYVVQILPFFAIAIAAALDQIAVLGERRSRWLKLAAFAVFALVAATFVVPRWWTGNQRALTANDNAGYAAAADYLRTAVIDRKDTTVVVDDVLWLDCVNAGYQQEKVIWFYKLDLDPAVKATLPNGWHDVDYIVSTPALRQDPGALPTVNTLLANSSVVAAFGPDEGRIEVRRINTTETTS
ncbi:ArnT family glycosyltransferase [Actinoplanes sp. HUAS TT8]|uniref:ArnT family glycosyltransferase n=1 Tax=Actinoplanes sp. HUAS TT8 TaxID=3447453 RepID=UPI003F51D4D6